MWARVRSAEEWACRGDEAAFRDPKQYEELRFYKALKY